MRKFTPNPANEQLLLMPEETALSQLDSRVRSTYIGGEQFVSALDILQYHGNKKNPAQAWQTTLNYMEEKQGVSLSPFCGVYQFDGSDGKRKKPTPVINLDGFLRIVQSADVPEWEPIREWLVKTGANAIRSKAQRKRDKELNRYQKAGFGDKPEVIRLAAYNEALKEYNELKSTYARLCENPDWALLANEEYLALFGAMANQLKAVLKSDNIRKALPTLQLDTMAFAEKRLREVLSTQQNLTNERIQRIIQVVIAPLGAYMRDISELQGIDHITGRPLLKSGK